MPDLAPLPIAALTPLGAALPRTDRIGAIRIAEVTDRVLASVTCRLGQDADMRAVAHRLFGTGLPSPGTCTSGPVYDVIWTAPDQWFVDAPFDSHADIAAILKSAFGATASVTEQTDGWVRFDIDGPGVADLLERLCPAPSRRMVSGSATRSLIDHIGVMLICRAAHSRFSLLGPRSFAASLHHALCAAATSIA